jgi:predicted Zn finger-like uncharacterized protein
MSLITRCPACTTMFRVVPDQLRISDGWVRCGQCDEVFDANVHLQSGSFIPPVVRVTQTPRQEPTQEFPDIQRGVVEESVAAVSALTELRPTVGQVEEALPSDDLLSVPGPLELAQFTTTPLGPIGEADVASPDPVYSASPPSFMQSEAAPCAQIQPLVKFSLGALSFILGLTFCLQLVVHLRHRLAATLPEMKTGLETVCAVFGCEIVPLREIDSVVIESSSFTKIHSDVYHVNLVLKNVARVALAVPALELTVTDLKDRVIVRRVLRGEQISATPQAILPGDDLAVSLPMLIQPPDGGEKISGYRLLAFYP